jgi:hypothetical protein
MNDDYSCNSATSINRNDRINCSTTFVGGYESIPYDHRFRGWYTATKQELKPVWSDPYPFFQGNDIGITYSIPLYRHGNRSRTIFHGVIAVDYPLGQLGTFFANKYMQVRI